MFWRRCSDSISAFFIPILWLVRTLTTVVIERMCNLAQDIVEDKVYFTGNKALNGSTTSLFSIKQLQSGKTYYLFSVIELNGEVSNLSAKQEVKVP